MEHSSYQFLELLGEVEVWVCSLMDLPKKIDPIDIDVLVVWVFLHSIFKWRVADD